MTKECGSCGMCCKILVIEELAKPANVWCQHAMPGKGCRIYHNRPAEVCEAFKCSWLLDPLSGPEWRPDKCGFIMREAGNVLIVEVDPSRPVSWKREPYRSQLRKWAAEALPAKGVVAIVCAGEQTIVFPDEEIAIGKAAKGDVLEGRYEIRGGVRRTVVKITRPDGSVSEVVS